MWLVSQAASISRCHLKEFPKSPRAAEWPLSLGRAYVFEDKKDKALASFQSVVRQYPGTPEAEKAKTLLRPR
jgi:TolA-binding protein